MDDEAAKLFDLLDVNTDGGINRDEFNDGLRSGAFVPGSNAVSRSTSAAASPSRSLNASGTGWRPASDARPATGDVRADEAALLPTIPEPASEAAQEKQEARRLAQAAYWEQGREQAGAASSKAPGEEVDFQKAFAEVEQRIAVARERYLQLTEEGETLRKENAELKEVVGKARANAERRILKKRAENVQLLADNAELEHFTLEARKLAEQKAKLPPSKSFDGSSDWDVLQQSNNAIRRRLERVLTRPQRMPLGGSLESPGDSSLEATPRIEAVEEWRTTSAVAHSPLASSPVLGRTRTDGFRPRGAA